jgi:1-phosphofructokinase
MMTHSPEVIAPETYTRLAADIRAMSVPVVADLSGPSMCGALAGGLDLLKVSYQDLLDGRVTSNDSKVLAEAMEALMAEGARTVVVSPAGDPHWPSSTETSGNCLHRRYIRSIRTGPVTR